MFCKLVLRNSRRSRKENGLFFSSLIVAITAFYIILSLSQQDVMRFLTEMESDAVDRLLTLIPVFYDATLVILFFLIYFSSKFQLGRRKHEFGVYLMMGMPRSRLFVLLILEDLVVGMGALLVGLPVAVLLSETTSLVTARAVGLGIIGHRFSFSAQAAVWTVAGFLFIKLLASGLLSGSICRQEVGQLLDPEPESNLCKGRKASGSRKRIILGILFLGAAYALGIRGNAWRNLLVMAGTLALGIGGTFLLFQGMEYPIERLARSGSSAGRPNAFHFRQLQESVVNRSSSMAVCSLLLLAALCCLASGIAAAGSRVESEPRVLDYTFEDPDVRNSVENVAQALEESGVAGEFADLFEIRAGHAKQTGGEDSMPMELEMENLLAGLEQMPQSETRDLLLNNLGDQTSPYLIPVSDYNRLLIGAGLPQIQLAEGEATVFMHPHFDGDAQGKRIMDAVLKNRPEVSLGQEKLNLIGPVHNTNIVTDRSITISFALILPDEMFQRLTAGDYKSHLNGILRPELVESEGMMVPYMRINEKLDGLGITYESYLQTTARQLFYSVASSYITIYLAVIFLIVSNTIIGVQFLMGQQRASKRYLTLVRLGATHEMLCDCANRQINWYFGLPIGVAGVSSLFGVQALLAGLLPAGSGGIPAMMGTAVLVLAAVCVVEWIYTSGVKRTSSRYLLTLMDPRREE